MPAEPFLIWLVVGAFVGLSADVIVKGYGVGRLGNLAVATLGASLGGWLIGGRELIFSNAFVGAVFGAILGAVVFLLLLPLTRRAG
jgi:uncharacterized membrane protein YeaQ/YmgE (transglycosylase-associated protein family)